MTKCVDIFGLPIAMGKPGVETKIEILSDSPSIGNGPNSITPIPVGFKLSVTPHVKGDDISFTARYSVIQKAENKAPEGQMRSEITSRDLYVSGMTKDGEEVRVDLLDPEQSKKISFLMVIKTKDQLVLQ